MIIKKHLIYLSTINPKLNHLASLQRLRLYAKACMIENIEVSFCYISLKEITLSNYKLEMGNVVLNSSISSHKFSAFNISKNFRILRKYLFENIVYTSYLLYPTNQFWLDVILLLIFKKDKYPNIFLELNEVKKYSVTSEIILKNILQSPLRILKNIIKKNAAALLEKFYRKFTGIIVISNSLYTYKPVKNLNKILIPILSDTKSYYKPLEYNAEKVFRIGFFGSVILKKENIDIFILALSKIKKKYKFTFSIFGQCDEKNLEELKELIKRFELEEIVTYEGLINSEEVNEKLEKYNLLVLPRGNTKMNKYGFSTKLSEYLVSGVPVLLTDVSDNSIYIKDNFNGFIVKPDSESEFLNKLIYIITNYSKIHKNIAKEAYKTAEKHFNYKNHSKTLADFLFPEMED